jgi:hypothetical protein
VTPETVMAEGRKLLTDIYALETKLIAESAEMDNRKKELALLGNKIAFEVLNEKDRGGKPRFTNDAQRKAEIEARLASDDTHQILSSEILSGKVALARVELDVKMAWANLRVLEIASRFSAGSSYSASRPYTIPGIPGGKAELQNQGGGDDA